MEPEKAVSHFRMRVVPLIAVSRGKTTGLAFVLLITFAALVYWSCGWGCHSKMIPWHEIATGPNSNTEGVPTVSGIAA